MNEWLVNHAYENTWCKPSIDRRLIAKGARLSRKTGELFGLTITKEPVRLPIEDRWFHVFQLGRMSPHFYELKVGDVWARLDRVVNDSGTIFTVYKENGEVYPASKAWIRKLRNQNVIIAVEDYDQLPAFSEDALYLRVYVGLYSDDPAFREENKARIYGDAVRNPTEVTMMIRKYNEWKDTLPGHTQAYVNGKGVENLTQDTMKLWDYVELVYDGMVEDVYHIPVNGLASFDSTLDNLRKYLLLPNTGTETIRFINDVDVAICYGNESRFYQQHLSQSLRQVTHNTYSLPTGRIQKFIDWNENWDDIANVVIKLKVRYSGMDRPLEYEHNRIHELYKLPKDKLIQAMVGVNSQVPEWRASHLENSFYNHIMAAYYQSINLDLCTKAYGYNSVSKMIADTPVKTNIVNDKQVAIAPPLLSRNSTAFEYDRQGRYLGHYPCINMANDVYTATNLNCELVDFVGGQEDIGLDIKYNREDYVLEEGINYRFYINKIVSGDNTAEYTDVTGDDNYYVISPEGLVQWNHDPDRERSIILPDTSLLVYCITGDFNDGRLDFTVKYRDEDGGRELPCPFEFEHLTIIMNGHTLVPGIDYRVEWPRVVVTNKRFLEQGSAVNFPKVVVVARGLIDKYVMPEHGFVRNGQLSNNCQFDVRDDKVININVGGRIVHREDIIFREDQTVGIDSALNGLPYCVTDPVIPLRDIVSQNTYEMREVAKELDGRVEDYLSVYFPTPPSSNVNPITEQYHVFSPMMNDAIKDIQRGLLNIQPDVNNHLTTQEFDRLMERYLDLLDFEPARNSVNLSYVVIHPHIYNSIIDLSELEYSFIERINSRYLGNKVVLNNHLRIKA